MISKISSFNSQIEEVQTLMYSLHRVPLIKAIYQFFWKNQKLKFKLNIYLSEVTRFPF